MRQRVPCGGVTVSPPPPSLLGRIWVLVDEASATAAVAVAAVASAADAGVRVVHARLGVDCSLLPL